ncbi:thioredoxin family protein [Joostella sp. CR20]|uniref:thioredoxin family protein n=1 Tax=Joostella sp. CR20 TaxID=2804312 RepID=UPI00313C81A7
MNIYKSIIILLVAFITNSNVQAQGINFFEGTYKEALAEAQKRNVPLFIDYYADWCGPCKMMDKNVYVDEKLGAFFNENFVSVKVDVEEEINTQLVRENQIVSMPTLMFVDGSENALARVSGSLDIENLMQMGQTVTGDVRSFEEIYTEYQKNSDDLEIMEELLNKAPAFVTLQEGMNKKKWIVRVEKIFDDYIEQKIDKGDALVNKEDYVIIKKFHRPEGKDDEIMEYMIAHMDGYIKEVGPPAAFYVIQHNTEYLESLAKDGDKSYETALERIKGDMKPAYDVIESDADQYELQKANCDALYALYKEKNVDSYIALKNNYFELQGETISPMSLARAAQVMYAEAGNKVTKEQNEVAKDWIVKSLNTNDIPTIDRINIIALLGDVNKKLGDLDGAEKAYNQAYLESAQIDKAQMQKYVQMLLKRKLEMLKLE